MKAQQRRRPSMRDFGDDQSQQQDQGSSDKIPTYPRKESGCIDPCPHFECVLSKDICDTNCQRTMDDPCQICKHNDECSTKRKLILLRPDVIRFAQHKGSEKMGFITIDKFAERRLELMDKVNKLEDEIETQKKIIDSSILPNSLAKMVKGKKLREYQNLKEEAQSLLKEQKYYFNDVGVDDKEIG